MANQDMITAIQVAKTPAFVEIALPDALERIAELNSQPLSLTVEAYRIGTQSVVIQANELMMAAAEETARRMNANH